MRIKSVKLHYHLFHFPKEDREDGTFNYHFYRLHKMPSPYIEGSHSPLIKERLSSFISSWENMLFPVDRKMTFSLLFFFFLILR